MYIYIIKRIQKKIHQPIISKQNLSGLILTGLKYNKKVKLGYISRGRLISLQNRNEKCYKLKYCLLFIAPLFICVYSKWTETPHTDPYSNEKCYRKRSIKMLFKIRATSSFDNCSCWKSRFLCSALSLESVGSTTTSLLQILNVSKSTKHTSLQNFAVWINVQLA